ncbi:unnamed protein product [Caenorhabditis angaria]|uniref:ARID domain-containing protein n=1 Tax=Caenorhabditis angaria TaxID=860376 RepID=A0A9P1ITM6_9PELO|nr:unnamed protein product [Caenorhabditis angaria]
MQSDDPAYLTVGTEVSAKFKGAFCEAKVKKVTRSIKIKVLLKESPFGHLIIDENALPKTAKIELNELVDVIQGKQTLRAVISNIKDCSKYHVVFNDGDEKELRRTQLCLKGGKHFDAAVNLDALPLYNPEQFSSPVVRGAKNKLLNKKRKGDESLSPLKRKKKKDGEDEDDDESDEEGSKKREKRAAASAATMAITEISGIGSGGGDTTEDSSADSSEEKERKKQNKKDEVEKKEKKKVGNIGNVGGGSGGVTIAAAEKEKPATTVTLHEKFLNIGKCVVVFEEPSSAIRLKESISISPSSQITSPCSSSASSSPNRIPSPLSASKASIPSSLYSVFYKKQWWPAVIVSQTAYKQYSNKPKDNIEKDQVCVRRFSDGKFLIRSESQIIPFSWLPTFSKKKLEEIQSFYSASSNSSTDNVDFSTSIEFTYAFVESGKLPKNWTMKEIFKGTPTVNIEGIKKKEEKKEEKKEKEKTIEKSSEEDSLSEDSDTEITAEERNFFIAQVYKFHEESASPINRVPVLGGKEIDLFNLQRIVQNYGGSKKVTANGKWNKVLNKLKLNGCPGATSVTIKKAYLRYLEPYSSFESKLGWATSDANISGARGERRSIIRPGHISMKQRRKSDAAKKSSRENSSIGSKEGSIIADVVAVVKSESPKPIEIETKKRRISENVEVREQNEEIGDELKLKLEEIKDEEAKSRENSITKKRQ